MTVDNVTVTVTLCRVNANARYSIEELAEHCGVTRRTVRYYVQEQLLPSPLGVGRGRHYGAEHLSRLRRLKELQEAGLSLAEVRARLWLDDAEAGGRDRATVPAASEPVLVRAMLQEVDAPFLRERAGPVRESWTRVKVDEGVELHLAADLGAVSPEALAALVRWRREYLRRDDPDARA